ncbi:MAG: 16S rRNA (guanine(527)-N(7))-methyltransferase RsmG [Acidobacteriota bacterium]
MNTSTAFAGELDQVLPADLPHRDTVMEKCAAHLALIVEANQYLNLTRILSPRDAAIKHVLDSVIPWRLFAGAKHVLDAGTGAGFPGIPLALVLPEVHFTLSESIQKKARFVESALGKLQLPNIAISTRRAEEIARGGAFDLMTARALAPVSKALGLLAPALRNGAKALLYKGPDAEQEIAAAEKELTKFRVRAEISMRYELPDASGIRTIIRLTSSQLP